MVLISINFASRRGVGLTNTAFAPAALCKYPFKGEKTVSLRANHRKEQFTECFIRFIPKFSKRAARLEALHQGPSYVLLGIKVAHDDSDQLVKRDSTPH